MKEGFGAVVGLAFCLPAILATPDCSNLVFEDKLMGPLVPCTWDNAKGMLCMENEQDVVVYPNNEQVAAMKSCGISLDEDGNSTRTRRDVLEASFTEFADEDVYSAREKRGFGGLSVNGFMNTKFRYRNILKNFVRTEWGKSKKEEIEPVARTWLETRLRLDGIEESGVFRSSVTRARNLEEQGSVTNVLRKNLEAQKAKKNWGFLNVPLILSELNTCTFTNYAGTTNQDVTFEKPDPSSNHTSGVRLWYYRVNCMQRSERVFYSLVVYADRLSFSDVSQTVEYWRNNPETLAKFILEAKKTKQLGTVETVGVGSSRSCSGTLCITKKTHHKIARLTEFELVEQIPKIIKTNVDHWIKDTKSIFVKQTLTISQKRDLEKWMRNSMLAQIFRSFSSFLDGIST